MENREPLEPTPNITDDDLRHITFVTGEGSYLYQLAITKSPNFTSELADFLTTPRIFHSLKGGVEDAEHKHPTQEQVIVDTDGAEVADVARILTEPELLKQAFDQTNPAMLDLFLAQVESTSHLFALYERLTGKQLPMEADWDFSNE